MRVLGEAGAYPTGLLWREGGRTLVAVTLKGLVVWDVTTGASRPAAMVGPQAWHAAAPRDGSRFATAPNWTDGPPVLWTLGPAGLTAEPFPAGDPLRGPIAFAPDGSALAGVVPAVERHCRIRWHALAWRDASAAFDGHTNTDSAAALVVSADGTRLASAASDDYVRVWDAATREEVGRRKMPRVTHLALSPDGRELAATVYESTAVWLLDATRKKLGKPRELAGHTTGVAGVAFAPGGRLASTGEDGRLCVWNDDGSLRAALAPGGKHLGRLAFAPDGLTVAVADYEGRVTLIDVD